MRRVFADSLYWIALCHQRDQWHAAAVKASQSLHRAKLVTTDEVLSEFLTALRHTPQFRIAASRQVDDVFADPSIIVLPQSRLGFVKGFTFYKARPDKGYSLTDCISMEAMRREGITDVLTHDNQFAQEGFVILL